MNERIDAALGVMASVGPRDFRAYLRQPGPDFEKADEGDVDLAIEEILAPDPNALARLRFSNLLRSWDNAKEAKWVGNTARNTSARRMLIHQLLKSGAELAPRIDALLPFYNLEEPLVIAERHQDWYAPVGGVRDYYWSEYVRYLRTKRNWGDTSLMNLENSTQAIVECLANPEAKEAYASRGLVMGYVQSGKTANFAGVVARAADAGYRLVIVLAGTWNILRNQTQRRFDKELLGKELLKNDESYTAHPPPDWPDFLEHGADPVELGHFTWQRLTRPDIDFKRLKAAIDNLEFEKIHKALPIYSSNNLHALPAKLLVIKKHSGILANLVKDLKLIRTKLTDLPTLIIDDESDQAGLNTVDPRRKKSTGAERSKTNLRIVELLELFPRGQYVGYTATPYANALVDPDDLKDLFPQDFIVSLDRPSGYMGVSDFFDPATDYEDLDKGDFSLPEIAYIRRVESAAGEDGEELKRALRSYVLSGAVKLYRHAQDPQRYKAEHVRHHTMLVHTSQLTGEQASVAERLGDLWDQCAFKSPKGRTNLEGLWRSDYAKVCVAQGLDIAPRVFDDLVPFLSETIRRIEKGPKVFLVVNSDTAEAPDFSAAPVWKIVVGGNKLSRGYTVEGLTVSYYRRVAGTADTLMQMGRWFGFRPGYRDLVRVFLGVKEGRRGDTDLVSLFKEVCRMEERFREEIRRYARRTGAERITPKQIPPLISVSGSLPPTAGNKMFNAILASKNFGGQRSMLTLAPTKPASLAENKKSASELLGKSKDLGRISLGGTWKSKPVEMTTVVREATNDVVIEFLRSYRWHESEYKYPERPSDTNLQIEFLQERKHGITSWLVLAPQRKVSFGSPFDVKGVGSLSVKERHRSEEGRGFRVFGEPNHRVIAEFLAAFRIEKDKPHLVSPNEATAALKNASRGILLLYPVRENEADDVSIGFELLFPENNLAYDLHFTVRKKSEKSAIVIEDDDEG
jgi:hypothetical protein